MLEVETGAFEVTAACPRRVPVVFRSGRRLLRQVRPATGRQIPVRTMRSSCWRLADEPTTARLPGARVPGWRQPAIGWRSCRSQLRSPVSRLVRSLGSPTHLPDVPKADSRPRPRGQGQSIQDHDGSVWNRHFRPRWEWRLIQVGLIRLRSSKSSRARLSLQTEVAPRTEPRRWRPPPRWTTDREQPRSRGPLECRQGGLSGGYSAPAGRDRRPVVAESRGPSGGSVNDTDVSGPP
jgi:hypothetical protein